MFDVNCLFSSFHRSHAPCDAETDPRKIDRLRAMSGIDDPSPLATWRVRLGYAAAVRLTLAARERHYDFIGVGCRDSIYSPYMVRQCL